MKPMIHAFLPTVLLFTFTSADDTKAVTKADDAKVVKTVDLVPDIREYKTVSEAIKADLKSFKDVSTAKTSLSGFVGLVFKESGEPVIDAVAPASPAEKAGLKAGDLVKSIAGETITTIGVAKDRLRASVADEPLSLMIERNRESLEISLKPKPTSKPFSAPANAAGSSATRAMIGVQVGEVQTDGGVEVSLVSVGGAAEKAGIKIKDLILKIDDKLIDESTGLRDILNAKKPGDLVRILLKRDGKDLELKATLTSEIPVTRAGGNFGSGWDERLPNTWKKKSYKLAVIGIEYPDLKHSESIKDADWEKSLFSVNEYKEKNATGQKVFGSMADYYQEVSCKTFKVEGSFLGWFEVSKKRMDYSSGNGTSNTEKTALLSETMDLVLAKNGKDSLKDYDGVFFLFSGSRVQTTRGSLYWPHRASFRHQGKSWPYFIVQEGGNRMTDISVFCHEFGHMIGLPDLYARPEVPGMEGVGVWCAMANQQPNGRPQHFSAWSKEQLGWLTPTLIDPRVKQKLILAPVEESKSECFKIPVKSDGSEYFLLENRTKKGFDASLPAEGLLIWRVLPRNQTQRVFLEESHGVEGPTGPRVFAGAVPFPSPANDSFTPYTTPSSKAQTGGGFDVHLSNIRRLPDGRIVFQIGYDFQ